MRRTQKYQVWHLSLPKKHFIVFHTYVRVVFSYPHLLPMSFLSPNISTTTTAVSWVTSTTVSSGSLREPWVWEVLGRSQAPRCNKLLCCWHFCYIEYAYVYRCELGQLRRGASLMLILSTLPPAPLAYHNSRTIFTRVCTKFNIFQRISTPLAGNGRICQ